MAAGYPGPAGQRHAAGHPGQRGAVAADRPDPPGRRRLADAAASAEAALAIGRATGADGYAAIAHCVLGMVELRRGDIAAAAAHIAARPAEGPQFADLYARAAAATAEAQVTEARDGPAAVIGQVRELCAGLLTGRGSCSATRRWRRG